MANYEILDDEKESELLKMKKITCCFFGHRTITVTEGLKKRLRTILKDLIENKGVRRFIFGSRSDFDALCHTILTEIKNTSEMAGSEQIVRVVYLTKSEYAPLEKDRKRDEKAIREVAKIEITLQGYEEIYKPQCVFSAGKAAYIERNQKMCDDSEYCIFYFDKQYKPALDCKSGAAKTGASGTALMYVYARLKKKNIYNLLERAAETSDKNSQK